MFRWFHAIVDWFRSDKSRLRRVLLTAITFAALLRFLGWVGTVGAAVTVVRAVISLGPWIILVAVGGLHVAVFWPEIRKRVFGASIAVRPIPGETLLAITEHEVIAKLAIRNLSSKTLTKCSVRLLDAYFIHNGYLCSGHQWHPSISSLRGESFFLRWSSTEPASDNRKYLDLPCDQEERFADILVLDKSVKSGAARFAAANSSDLESKCQGVDSRWWKLRVLIASATASETVSLLAACSDRDPGPIALDLWEPRGEQILASEKAKKSRT